MKRAKQTLQSYISLEWRGIFLVTFLYVVFFISEFIFESETQTRFSLKSKITKKNKSCIARILVKFSSFDFVQ